MQPGFRVRRGARDDRAEFSIKSFPRTVEESLDMNRRPGASEHTGDAADTTDPSVRLAGATEAGGNSATLTGMLVADAVRTSDSLAVVPASPPIAVARLRGRPVRRELASRTDYFHLIPGRMRIQVPELRRSQATAEQLEAVLAGLEGVVCAQANPLTANLLVHFDASRIGADEIVDRILDLGLLRPGAARRESRPRSTRGVQCPSCGERFTPQRSEPFGREDLARGLLGWIASNALEFALKRAVLALL
jgi:hypothetical protein